jgi:hypothetical protein
LPLSLRLPLMRPALMARSKLLRWRPMRCAASARDSMAAVWRAHG